MIIAHKKPAAPLYSTLSSVQLVLDATGLRDNVTNSYGQVTAGMLQIWNGITPGVTGVTRVWTADAVGTPGEASSLKFQDGYIEFPGYVVLSNTGGSTSSFEFMSNVSPVSNLKWTSHVVCKIAEGENVINWAHGLFGNNGTSQGSRGNSIIYDDRILAARTNGVLSTITKGSAGFIVSATPDNIIVPGVPFVFTVETDMALTAADRQKFFINGVQFAHTVSSPSTATSGPPAFLLQVGAAGNKVTPLRGWISHIILQSVIETSGVRDAFIQSLIPFKNKTNSNYFYNVDESRTFSIYETLATAGRYYFVQGLLQDPSNPEKIIQIYHNGNQHLEDNDKRVSQRISTDGGRIFGSETDAYDYDGAGTYAVQDGEWGWESTGRIHGITDWHTTIGVAGSSNLLFYHYSDDGGSTYTTIDITSIVPSDGLATFRAHGNIIEGGDGFLYAALYKLTDEGDFTQSANYLLRKPVGSSTTWTVLTVRAVGSTYINEMALAALDNQTILILARDESTLEWNQYIATSNGTSIADQGAVTFGETATVASPPLLTTFNITTPNGTFKAVAAWLSQKGGATKEQKIVYGLASDIIASGVAGWNTTTKTTIYSGTQIIHYGRAVHKRNGFNAIASFAREPNPPTLTENNLVTAIVPSTHYYNVKVALGL